MWTLHMGARSQTQISSYLPVGIVGRLGFGQDHPIVLTGSPYRLPVEVLFGIRFVQNAFVTVVVKFSWLRLHLLRWWSNSVWGRIRCQLKSWWFHVLFDRCEQHKCRHRYWRRTADAATGSYDGRAGQGTGGLIVRPAPRSRGPSIFLDHWLRAEKQLIAHIIYIYMHIHVLFDPLVFLERLFEP